MVGEAWQALRDVEEREARQQQFDYFTRRVVGDDLGYLWILAKRRMRAFRRPVVLHFCILFIIDGMLKELRKLRIGS